MLRESKMVRGLVDWLTGGLSTRLDFVERDIESLQHDTKKLSKNQDGIARAVVDHERRLIAQQDQMIALRRMHGALNEKLGKPFPGKLCPSCGGGMMFERVAAEKAYALECANRCGERLLLPETQLLKTLSGGVR